MVVMRNCSRWDVLQVFLAIDTGKHVNMKSCEYFKVAISKCLFVALLFGAAQR